MGALMLVALILVCSATVASDIAECTRENAQMVMRVPAEFGNPITRFMHAQAYVAETLFGQELDSEDRVRIVCVRREGVLASH
jgi:hypothetical protein